MVAFSPTLGGLQGDSTSLPDAVGRGYVQNKAEEDQVRAEGPLLGWVGQLGTTTYADDVSGALCAHTSQAVQDELWTASPRFDGVGNGASVAQTPDTRARVPFLTDQGAVAQEWDLPGRYGRREELDEWLLHNMKRDALHTRAAASIFAIPRHAMAT